MPKMRHGTGCPITMTFSCVLAIKKSFLDADTWISKLLISKYDYSNKPRNEIIQLLLYLEVGVILLPVHQTKVVLLASFELLRF